MYTTIDFENFCDLIIGGFSYAAKEVIYDYLQKKEYEKGESMEFIPELDSYSFIECETLSHYNKELGTNFDSFEELESEHEVVVLKTTNSYVIADKEIDFD